jgi:hypothetical protein
MFAMRFATISHSERPFNRTNCQARVLTTLLLAGSVCVEASARQTPGPASLQTVLQRAGEYVITYERGLSTIVADEEYMQTSSELADSMARAKTRRLRSDVLTVRGEAGQWIGFRDVYEVDGQPVRDRNDRLARLFLEPHADALTLADRIATESARFNLNPGLSRTINLPLLALQFLRPLNQPRSEFKTAGTKVIAGKTTIVVTFQERATPRLIQTNDNAAATGRFWIEPESGRVLETELFISTSRRPYAVTALIHVAYGEDQRLNFWVPLSMTERYRGSPGLIEGRAVYSKFRKFGVTTDEIVKAP